MTQKAYPLDNTQYLAEDVRLYHIARTTGIFNVTGEDLKVSASGGMNVKISPGYAFLLTAKSAIGGFTYGNTSDVTLTIDIASSITRYDYISVRYVKGSNSCELAYVRGDDGRPTTPVRNENIYEIILAIIQVPANASAITAGNIIDTRLNETFCGIVTDGTNKLPTQPMYDQFRELVTKVESMLDGSVAGNLSNRIDANTKLIGDKEVALNQKISKNTESINANEDSIVANAKAIKNTNNSIDDVSKRVTSLENSDFKWKVGTAYPDTNSCPNGYFYFQIG